MAGASSRPGPAPVPGHRRVARDGSGFAPQEGPETCDERRTALASLVLEIGRLPSRVELLRSAVRLHLGLQCGIRGQHNHVRFPPQALGLLLPLGWEQLLDQPGQALRLHGVAASLSCGQRIEEVGLIGLVVVVRRCGRADPPGPSGVLASLHGARV